jgi:hypothetical protein
MSFYAQNGMMKKINYSKGSADDSATSNLHLGLGGGNDGINGDAELLVQNWRRG